MERINPWVDVYLDRLFAGEQVSIEEVFCGNEEVEYMTFMHEKTNREKIEHPMPLS